MGTHHVVSLKSLSSSSANVKLLFAQLKEDDVLLVRFLFYILLFFTPPPQQTWLDYVVIAFVNIYHQNGACFILGYLYGFLFQKHVHD